MIRLAANLSMMFNEWPFMERFRAARDNGFDAVEFLFPYDFAADEIAAALQKNGLTQALFNLPPGDWEAGERGIAALPDRMLEFRSGVALALRYAEIFGTRRLHVMSGRAERRDAAACSAYRDALRYACDEAGPAGIEIMIEPINRRDMPGYFLDDFAFAADLIAELARPNLRLQFDIYHRQILQGDVIRGLQALFPLIGHVQIAGVPERHEPGSGELDDIRILRELEALGYQGFVGCEYRPAAGTVAGLAWRDRI
ncbi:hydroxypyruvate isomerase [Dongia mobilis]|uniref:Hydroxypyruvate isomerase n=1 Tax=Dongia mobilis TaxID=578943 RepID=A0A4R6WSE6_9PROT|nr:2-oxo-tetronate isomerase [Dongia mobilis]TDQ84572.1 hydroxypyruvate isomerase [Dongia mobilis]